MKPAIVLLSGGLDSTTVLAHALQEGYDVRALNVSYGQRHEKEWESAFFIAKRLGVEISQAMFPGYKHLASFSSLTSKRDVPTDQTVEEMSASIPNTYVPLRNTLFVTLAAAALESWILTMIEDQNVPPGDIESATIFVGANALDYAGYPDCRPEFYSSITDTIFLGSKIGAAYSIPIRIEAPIIQMTKADIVRRALELNAPIDLTWSCYEGLEHPCGRCDTCILRVQAFAEVGVLDPALSLVEPLF